MRAGVVRAMACSDHWRCVSTPRCARTSWKVTSICQRRANQRRIWTGIGLLVGAQQGLGGELAQGIANEHPPDGDRDKARVVPDSRLRDILDTAVSVAIPAGQRHRRPDGRWIGAYLLEGGQA